jgi:hypothetical protein
MPGLDYFSSMIATTSPTPAAAQESVATEAARPDVYYNARLDPKNYLEGPLSPFPSTRLRQMLARPGIIVSSDRFFSKPVRQHCLTQRPKVAPGICDGISARCAVEAGFECLYQRLVIFR